MCHLFLGWAGPDGSCRVLSVLPATHRPLEPRRRPLGRGGADAASSRTGATGEESDRATEPDAAPVVPVRRGTRKRKRPQKLSVNWSDPVYDYV